MKEKPNPEQIKETVEDVTSLDWHITKDDSEGIRLVQGQYELQVVYADTEWRSTLELYDKEWSDEEPRWAVGPIRSKKDLDAELRDLIAELPMV